MLPVKILLLITYDGTHFNGWQDNLSNASIEGCLKKAFFKLYQKHVSLDAASRTDKGVHAHNQVVIAFIDSQKISITRLAAALNANLPDSIRVKKAFQCPADFHPSLSAKKKTYLYQIQSNRVCLPFIHQYCWHIDRTLDIKLMQSACRFFFGKKDFSALSNRKELKEKDPVCEIFEISVFETSGLIQIHITGDRFLYKMCRTIVGTLVQVGLGKIELNQLVHILEKKDRTLAGMTAPAAGLFLQNIDYPHLESLFTE